MTQWYRRAARTILATLTSAALLVPTAEATAQQIPVELWLRPMVAVPIGDFAGRDDGVDAGTGFGFDIGGAVDLGPASLYAEYQYADMTCGECEEVGLDDKAMDRGWGAGVMVPFPYGDDRIRPWVRAGITAHRLGFRAGDESRYSKQSMGWAVGGGIVTDLLPWLGLEPSLLVRSYDAEFDFAIDAPSRDIRVTFLAAGLTFRVRPAAFLQE